MQILAIFSEVNILYDVRELKGGIACGVQSFASFAEHAIGKAALSTLDIGGYKRLINK